MPTQRLRILQLNTGKAPACMEALINDSHTESKWTYCLSKNHQCQHTKHSFNIGNGSCTNRHIQMTPNKNETWFTSTKRLSSASYRQIACDSLDVVAIKVRTPTNQTLIFSVYTPPINDGEVANGTELQPTLDAINQTTQKTTSGTDKFDIIVGGDFNIIRPGAIIESTATG